MADLTPARRRALAMLLVGEATRRRVRYSNSTTPAVDAAAQHPSRIWRHSTLDILWQTAEWLIRAGYAIKRPGGAEGVLGDTVELTDSGRALAISVVTS